MIIKLVVNDSRGRHWYTEEYEEVISQFSYDSQNRQKNDPFQAIYNKIANDLLAYRQRNIEASEAEIRTVSELLFAQRFCPFGIISPETETESTSSLRCPLITILCWVDSQHPRAHFMFIDTVQDYFATYVRQMRLPYDSWREQSYQETITLRARGLGKTSLHCGGSGSCWRHRCSHNGGN